jgi:hypothetical protein
MSCAVNEPRNDKSHGRCRGSFCSLPAGYPVSPLGEQALQLVEKWNWLADMLGNVGSFRGRERARRMFQQGAATRLLKSRQTPSREVAIFRRPIIVSPQTAGV